MTDNNEYVSFEKTDKGLLINLCCEYPQELLLDIDIKDIYGLGKFFVSLGNGKKKALWKAEVKAKGFSYIFKVSACMPDIVFEYNFYNREFKSVSDSCTCYDIFDKAALLRFGNELLSFENTGSALLCER